MATAPSPAMNGDMYYNSVLNKFQKYENGSWSDLGATSSSVDLYGIYSSLDLKAPLASPTFTGTVSGITAAMVGLGNVSNVAQMPLYFLDTNSNLADNSDAKVPSQKAVKSYVDLQIAAINLMGGSAGTTTVTKEDVGLGNVDNVAQMPLSYLDVDGTFAANSDVKVASQAAVKIYVDDAVAGKTTEAYVDAAVAAEATSRTASVTDLQTQITNIISNTDPASLDSLSEVVAAFEAADSNLNNAITSLASSASTAASTKIPLSYLDTDSTFAANSDIKIASQAATKVYADTKVAKTTTVNGHVLSSNITISASDVGLGNVDNTSDATKNSAVATLTNKTLTSPTISSPTFSGTVTGLALSSLTGTLAISAGGTGQTTAAGALNALLPAQTSNSGKVLQTDGTTASWVTPAASSTPNPTLTNPTWTTQNLTFGATTNWNADNGGGAVLTLTGNTTMANPTNLKNGATYVLKVIQDSTGSRMITWDSMFKWPAGAVPVLSTSANSIDLISFYYDGSILIGSYLRGIA
jgi:hypothetical protein